MKHLEKAHSVATRSANFYNVDYCVMLTKNGQYMVERLSYITTPRGKGIYTPEQLVEIVKPKYVR